MSLHDGTKPQSDAHIPKTLSPPDIPTYPLVRFTVIAGEAAQLDVPLFEVLLTHGGRTQLGGAYGGVIGRVHEDDAPRVAQVLVQVERVRILRRSNQVGELVV